MKHGESKNKETFKLQVMYIVFMDSSEYQSMLRAVYKIIKWGPPILGCQVWFDKRFNRIYNTKDSGHWMSPIPYVQCTRMKHGKERHR